MRQMLRVVSIAAAVAVAVWTANVAGQARVTLFEGARLIVGDGQVIENGAFTVAGNQFGTVGRTGEVVASAGANRVALTGKTVMPAIIDTHTHLSRTRDML